VTDRVNRGAQRGACTRVDNLRETVVNPQAVAPRSNESGPPQVREMTGNSRLREPQGLVNVADAGLTSCQDA
jgi:hypothetical protein